MAGLAPRLSTQPEPRDLLRPRLGLADPQLDAVQASNFERGARSGVLGLQSGLSALEADIGQARGNAEMEAAARAELERLQQRGALYAPRVGSLADVNSVGDFTSFVQSGLGQGLTSMAPAIGGALAGRVLGVGATPGAFAGSFVPQAGEVSQRIQNDPVAMANTTARERLLMSGGAGAAGAALESVVPGGVVGKLGARTTARGVGRDIARQSGREAVTEALQSRVGQETHTLANAARDTSGDTMELIDSAALGGLTGGAVRTAVTPVDAARMAIDRFTGRTPVPAADPRLENIAGRTGMPPEVAREAVKDPAVGVQWMEQNDQLKQENVATLLDEALADPTLSDEARAKYQALRDGPFSEETMREAAQLEAARKAGQFVRETIDALGKQAKKFKERASRVSVDADDEAAKALRQFVPHGDALSDGDARRLLAAIKPAVIAGFEVADSTTEVPQALYDRFGENTDEMIDAIESIYSKDMARGAEGAEELSSRAIRDAQRANRDNKLGVLTNLIDDHLETGGNDPARYSLDAPAKRELADGIDRLLDRGITAKNRKAVMDGLKPLFGDKTDAMLEAVEKYRAEHRISGQQGKSLSDAEALQQRKGVFSRDVEHDIDKEDSDSDAIDDDTAELELDMDTGTDAPAKRVITYNGDGEARAFRADKAEEGARMATTLRELQAKNPKMHYRVRRIGELGEEAVFRLLGEEDMKAWRASGRPDEALAALGKERFIIEALPREDNAGDPRHDFGTFTQADLFDVADDMKQSAGGRWEIGPDKSGFFVKLKDDTVIPNDHREQGHNRHGMLVVENPAGAPPGRYLRVSGQRLQALAAERGRANGRLDAESSRGQTNARRNFASAVSALFSSPDLDLGALKVDMETGEILGRNRGVLQAVAQGSGKTMADFRFEPARFDENFNVIGGAEATSATPKREKSAKEPAKPTKWTEAGDGADAISSALTKVETKIEQLRAQLGRTEQWKKAARASLEAKITEQMVKARELSDALEAALEADPAHKGKNISRTVFKKVVDPLEGFVSPENPAVGGRGTPGLKEKHVDTTGRDTRFEVAETTGEMQEFAENAQQEPEDSLDFETTGEEKAATRSRKELTAPPKRKPVAADRPVQVSAEMERIMTLAAGGSPSQLGVMRTLVKALGADKLATLHAAVQARLESLERRRGEKSELNTAIREQAGLESLEQRLAEVLKARSPKRAAAPRVAAVELDAAGRKTARDASKYIDNLYASVMRLNHPKGERALVRLELASEAVANRKLGEARALVRMVNTWVAKVRAEQDKVRAEQDKVWAAKSKAKARSKAEGKAKAKAQSRVNVEFAQRWLAGAIGAKPDAALAQVGKMNLVQLTAAKKALRRYRTRTAGNLAPNAARYVDRLSKALTDAGTIAVDAQIEREDAAQRASADRRRAAQMDANSKERLAEWLGAYPQQTAEELFDDDQLAQMRAQNESIAAGVRRWVERALDAKDAALKAQLDKMSVEQLNRAFDAVEAHGKRVDLDPDDLKKVTRLEEALRDALSAAEDAAESTERTSKANAPGATSEAQRAEAEATVKKLVAGVEVRWKKAIKNDPSIQGLHRLYKDGREVIELALGALNPLSVAHHESMHSLFARMQKSTHKATQSAFNVLSAQMKGPAATRALRAMFAGNAAALADMGLDGDPNAPVSDDALHERMAYYFQSWAAGHVRANGMQRGLFGKIIDLLRRAIGVMSDEQKVDDFLKAFNDGRLRTPSAMESTFESIEAREAALKRFAAAVSPLTDRLKDIAVPAGDALRWSKDVDMQHLARLFDTQEGDTGGKLGFLQATDRARNAWTGRWLKGIEGATEQEIKAASEVLSKVAVAGDPPELTGNENIDKIVTSTLGLMRKLHQYQLDADVRILKMKKNKDGKKVPTWVALPQVHNYFPRVWDFAKIGKNTDKFRALLMQPKYEAALKEIAGENMSVEQVVDSIINRLLGAEPGEMDSLPQNGAAGNLTESEQRLGYTPWAQHTNNRALDFIEAADFAEFTDTNLGSVVSTYIHQATKRAEYARSFGYDGNVIRGAMTNMLSRHTARDGEETALKRARHFARSIQAMEGTLGADINPRLRSMLGAATVYQNIRLMPLALFAQIIDPVGVLARGGSMGDAWSAFRRGVSEVAAGWSGKEMRDAAALEAEALGTVEAEMSNAMLGEAFGGTWLQGRARKINDKLFQVNGMRAWNRGMRIAATQTALKAIPRYAALARAGDPNGARWLDELGLTLADVQLAPDGRLAYQQGEGLDRAQAAKLQQAVYRWVNGAVLRPNAAHRPALASDPHFAFMYQYKQFTYSFTKVILRRLANEMRHANTDPLLRYAALAIPAIIGADVIKGTLLNGGDLPAYMNSWSPTDFAWHGIERSGLTGVGTFALDAGTGDVGSLAGPSVNQVLDLLSQDADRTAFEAVPGLNQLKALRPVA